MNRQIFESLNAQEKYIFAQSILNPIWRLGIENQLRQINEEIVAMALPSEWSFEKLITFAKRYQHRQHTRKSCLEMLALIEEAQAYVTNLKQMET